MLLDEFGGSFARAVSEAAGEDEGFAGEFLAFDDALFCGGLDAVFVELPDDFLVLRLGEKFGDAGSDFGADFADFEHDCYETRERGHGREEYRSYITLRNTTGIRHRDEWAGLTTIGMCYSERTVGGVTGEEVRYFIGSKEMSAKSYGTGLRNHWRIENNLHWQLDVTFQEDRNRVSKRNAAENLALLRRLTLSLLKAHPAKLSIAKKRFAAALDPDFLDEILRGDGILEKR